MSYEQIDTAYALSTGRTTYYQFDIDNYERWGDTGRASSCPDASKANLISSEIAPDRHMPVIDCDFPIQAVPSSTAGHYHLYVDQELTWEQYKALLEGFYKAGLIQKAWYRNALKDKRSYVRLPNVRKKPEPAPEPPSDDSITALLQQANVPTVFPQQSLIRGSVA